MSSESKTARIEARVAPEVRDMIVAAAELEGRSLSDFLVMSAKTRAEETLQKQTLIQLAAQDQQRFVEALLNPPPLNDTMRQAISRHAQLFDPS